MGRHVMIMQVFFVEKYWKVVVYYNVDYSLFNNIYKELKKIETSDDTIQEVFNKLREKEAKGVTCSNIEKHISIIIFNTHASKKDYIDSIVHEAEHVKQAIMECYHIEDKGETPAYTIGYIVGKMYRVFGKIVCDCYDLK